MKIEKLSSGSYRVRKMCKGKKYTVIFDHKPTQKEALLALADEINTETENRLRMTFKTAAERYCEAKEGVLSPSTLRGYKSIRRNISDRFSGLLINNITGEDIQKEISSYSKTHSPKSTLNCHGFIYSVMGMYRPKFVINTTLPKKKRTRVYIPTDEDIRRIIKKASGTRYEVPLLLALSGLRRSEICGLSLDDFSDSHVYIHQVMVQDENNKWVSKDLTKTEDGTRSVRIPSFVIQKVRDQGYVFKGNPNTIYYFLMRCEKELGIQHFNLHKLRHYFASSAHALNIPDEFIMEAGGWKSADTMKVYRHALSDKKEAMDQKFCNHLMQIAGSPSP